MKVEKRHLGFRVTKPSEYHPVHEGLDLPLWRTPIVLVVSREYGKMRNAYIIRI